MNAEGNKKFKVNDIEIIRMIHNSFKINFAIYCDSIFLFYNHILINLTDIFIYADEKIRIRDLVSA